MEEEFINPKIENEELEDIGIEILEEDEIDDFDYEEYLSDRDILYREHVVNNANHVHSPFLVSDRCMRVVRKFGIKTTLGNDIHLGDQMAGVVIVVPGFFQVPDEAFYLIYKENEAEVFGDLVDNIWSDFVNTTSQNEAIMWHDFYDTYHFMSLKEKYYKFLETANNINISHNIFDYL